MLIRLTVVLLATASLGLSNAAEGQASLPEKKHMWQPADSVAVRTYTDAVFSPNRERYLYTYSYGELASDSVIDVLEVFSSDDTKAALLGGTKPQPLHKLVRRTYDHAGNAFFNPRWSEDGISITYGGADEQNRRQLYSLNVVNGVSTALTEWPTGTAFALQNLGKTIVARDVPSPREAVSFQYPMHLLGAEDIQEVFYRGLRYKPHLTYISYDGAAPWVMASRNFDLVAASDISGKTLVGVAGRPTDLVPEFWYNYDGAMRRGILSPPFPTEFKLVDAEKGTERSILGSPTGDATKIGSYQLLHIRPKALWAANGRNVVLVNTTLPIDDSHPERAHIPFIVGYDIKTGEYQILEPLQDVDGVTGKNRQVIGVDWLKPGLELLVRHRQGTEEAAVVYRLQQGKWIGEPIKYQAPSPIANRGGELAGSELRVVMEQDANTPPLMVAYCRDRRAALDEPDPALTNVSFSREEPLRFLQDGQTRVGGLILPPHTDGRAIPLVIQVYDYKPDTFHPDGAALNGSQSLISEGIAVLIVDMEAPGGKKKGHEVEDLANFVGQIDAAVGTLAAKGIVNPEQVGLVGFSRGGYYTSYAISHPGKIALAAAMNDDSFPGTYSYILTNMAGSGSDGSHNYDGSFWEKKETWLQHEPSFNVDRVRTPTMFAIHEQSSVLYVTDMVGAFVFNKKPYEYLVFPKGTHNLEMPRERVASQQATIDWMKFWLKGISPSDPKLASRWAILRKEQDEVLKTPPPPKGKWVFQADAEQPAWTPPENAKPGQTKGSGR